MKLISSLVDFVKRNIIPISVVTMFVLIVFGVPTIMMRIVP